MKEIIVYLLVGLGAGALSGFFGVGGGVLVIPALVMILGFTQLQAQGTSLAMLLPPIGVLAVINYYNKGAVNITAALVMSVTFLIGSYFASKFAVNLPEAMLKKAFGVFLMAYAIKLFLD